MRGENSVQGMILSAEKVRQNCKLLKRQKRPPNGSEEKHDFQMNGLPC